MALFLIERRFAEQLEISPEVLAEVEAYNARADLKWLFSFLSADQKKTYCLYEANEPDALRRQASDLGLPADTIVEVSEVNPTMFSSPASATGHLASGESRAG
jgi:hypothetical protein